MVGHYHVWFVVLSILIAIAASFASLRMVERLRRAVGWHRWKWIVAGGTMLGGGIWSMHFVAMLAYEMDMTVTYDMVLLTISILSSALASFLAFYIISQKNSNLIRLLIGSFFIGTGIITMHYVGMEAMRMPASIVYDPWIVALSVVIAYSASFVALIVFRAFSDQPSKFSRYSWGAAVVLGVAICGMHYTGMEAATFFHDESKVVATMAIYSETLGYTVTLGILLLIGLFTLLVRFDSKMEHQTEQLQFMDNMYQSIIESANDAVITMAQDGTIYSWNSGAARMFGFNKDKVVGQPLTMIMPDKYRKAHDGGVARYMETKQKRVIGQTVELEGQHESGRIFPIELSLSTTMYREEVFFTGMIRDISERIQNQERIEELVYKDELTKLPNRRMLNEHIGSLLEKVDEKCCIAVLFFDLDRFKQINDVYGHRLGDSVLIEVTKRLQSNVESSPFIARQSGDEFVMVLGDTSSYHAGRLAEQLIETIKAPIAIEELELFITFSIGISLYPEDGQTAEALIKHADTAMYQAKMNGGGHYQFFTTEINDAISRKMMLETGLRKAVEREEIEIYYQPQVDVTTGNVNSFEALVRWNHPELGLIPPLDFIPLAEETKLIIPIGEWILSESCRQFLVWTEQGHSLKHISVNISAVQFQEPDFPQMVVKVIKDTGINPEHLDLELTESVIQNPDIAIPFMHQLKAMGVRLSLDDFGTGYSSLSYLKEFPLDTLKIDKSFTQTVLESEKDQAVVDTIIHMALKLNLNVIAEGVETDGQLQYLLGQKCHQYQGYLYSAPIPKEEIEGLLHKKRGWTIT
ncbi:bifunctional diguanylate cyclase/phosphodiesterase [Halobacillus salinus]|nr:EAL domain-containing protein [Halobacillus salinus]